jgi:hypothetical protein
VPRRTVIAGTREPTTLLAAKSKRRIDPATLRRFRTESPYGIQSGSGCALLRDVAQR